LIADAVGVGDMDEDVLMLDTLPDVEEVSDDCWTEDMLVDEDPDATVEVSKLMLTEEEVDPELDAEVIWGDLVVPVKGPEFVADVTDVPSVLVDDDGVKTTEVVVLVSVGAGTSPGSTDRHSEAWSSKFSTTARLPSGVRQNPSTPCTET